MDKDFAELATLSRSSFSLVMTEFHQKFKEKNLDASIDDDSSCTSSGFGSLSAERTQDISDCSYSLPEFRSDTGTKPQYSVNCIMGSIYEETIRNALRNLRPVPHPKDFAAETCSTPSPVASPPSSPRTMTSFTNIEDLNIAQDKGTRNIEDAKELMHYVEDYLQSVDFEDVTNEGQQSNIQATPIPCPENIYGWQTGSYLNGGLRRHTDCIDLDTDMTDRFIVKLKPRKKKRGLMSRLRFWMQQSKSGQDVNGIGSGETNKDNKRCGGWKLFCCRKSTTDE